MDFDWPLRTTWNGYLNPHYVECPICHGNPEPEREFLERIVMDLLRGYKAMTEIRELTTGLAGRAPAPGLGHDTVDRFVATNKIIEAAGLDPKTWGICPHCIDGIDKKHYDEHEAWKPQDPPEGQGYQLWETTSEGSPVSPVFGSLEELCTWCEDNASPWSGYKLSAQQWMELFTTDDSIPLEERHGDK